MATIAAHRAAERSGRPAWGYIWATCRSARPCPGGAMPRRSRCARTASAAASTRPPPRSSRAWATPTRPRRRSPARPGCRRRRSTSTSTTRKTASARCSTRRRRRCCGAIGGAGDRRRGRPSATRASATASRSSPFLEVLAEHPRLRADPAGRDHRRRAAGDRAPRPRARRVRRPTSTTATREDAAAGLVPRLASPHDAFAIVGAVVELASRQIRTGEPGRRPGPRPRSSSG